MASPYQRHKSAKKYAEYVSVVKPKEGKFIDNALATLVGFGVGALLTLLAIGVLWR